MTPKSLLQGISNEVSPFLSELQFEGGSRTGRFTKQLNDLQQRITFSISKWSNGSFRVDHFCEYRIPNFAEIHNRYLNGISERDKRLIPTISQYYSNLTPKDFDWELVSLIDESEIPRVARNLEQIISQYSIPYLNRFDSADAIIQGFKESRARWAVEDPIHRYELLMTDSILKRDRHSFDDWFNEALQFCGDRNDGAAVWLINIAHSFKRDYFADGCQ